MYKRINYRNVEFTLDPNGKLTKMINNGDPKDIDIPAVLPTGEKITTIGEQFCIGYYYDIRIDDSISKVEPCAFTYAHVDGVSWPSMCPKIPEGCFSYSFVKSVTNIDNVIRICSNAFRNSNIKSLKWPEKCKRIPAGCFSESKLREITNIQEVEEIGISAFSDTSIISLEWPSKCKYIPEWCFYGSKICSISGINNVTEISGTSFTNSNLKSITWPSYCESSLYYVIMGMCGLEELDLSKAVIVNFGGDINYLGIKNVTFPYYMSDDMLNEAVRR